MRSRSFYVMTLRANAKKKDLIKFLEKEWVFALKSCRGCLEVEILADYRDRAFLRDGIIGIPWGALGAILCFVRNQES